MIAEQIKEKTHTHHQALEASMIRRIKAIENTDDYVALLQIFYSYFVGLENKIKRFISNALPDLENRRKAGELAKDIHYFGADLPQLAVGDHLPEINNHYQAMAALYVIEGSTLGGIYISKMIAKQLNLSSTEGLTFFEGYGDKTKQMWEEFKVVLNDQPSNDIEEQQMTATANETFLKFKRWMDNTLSAESSI
jgi:heme oxygenase